ncbi:hypothetical protein DRP05_10565 [Archaeoglobales archaeon]|nr:MAG: hypothetical protein DRO97_11245 [Archaeoglobales archaeon]RLI77290.1 MAG: hypothetical protein DRP05_10565 [Archaeoglobales archaeon]
MTGTAVVVPYSPLHHPLVEPTHRVEIFDKWKKLLDDTKWENIIKLSIDEAKKPVNRLIKFIEAYKEYFSIDVRPVSEDPIEDHLKPHYTHLNKLVHDRFINARNAVKLAEHIYLYDSVLPHLAETIVKPKENEEFKVRIINIPEKLYEWMFKLDYVWEKLIKRKALDLTHFKYLEDHKIEFLNKAKELKVFLPIPPRKLSEVSNLETLWFRNYKVEWDLVHNYLYSKISTIFSYE